jgi:hypothetical protein
LPASYPDRVIVGWLMAHLLLGGMAADAFWNAVEEQEVPDWLTKPSS